MGEKGKIERKEKKNLKKKKKKGRKKEADMNMHVRVRERERATYCVCAFIYVYTYIYISIFLLCRYFLVTCYNNPIRSVKRIHIIYIYVVNIKKVIVEEKASAHESRSEYFDRD